jgi:hypothetical protein
MSSDTRPSPALWKVLPRSVERHTPPISSPAKTRSGSSGSKVICVTRGRITAGQVSGRAASTRCQVFGPSVERKMTGGRVPGEDQVGIVRRTRDRPDAQAVHRRGQVGPFAARDIEPVDAGIGAGEQLARALRVRASAQPASRCTFRRFPRNAAAFRRGRRCTRRTVPPCRHRGEVPRVPPCGVLVFDLPAGAGPRPMMNRRQIGVNALRCSGSPEATTCGGAVYPLVFAPKARISSQWS